MVKTIPVPPPARIDAGRAQPRAPHRANLNARMGSSADSDAVRKTASVARVFD